MNYCEPINCNLQIFIPTFDRSRQLDCMLSSLFNDFTDAGIFFPVHVQINPGYSTCDYNSVISKYHNFATFSVNTVNFGANINILNCISASSSDYSIVLGDDDVICHGFAELLSKAISILNNNSALSSIKLLDTQSFLCREQIAFSLNDLLAILPESSRLGRIGSLIHLSGWIFRVSLIKPLLSYAYRLSSTCFAHIIPSLLLLSDGSYGIYFLSISSPFLKHQGNTQSWDPGPVYSSLILGMSNCFGYLPDKLSSFLLYDLLGALSLWRVFSVYILSLKNNSSSRASLVLFSLVLANFLRLPLLVLLLIPRFVFRFLLNKFYRSNCSFDRI